MTIGKYCGTMLVMMMLAVSTGWGGSTVSYDADGAARVNGARTFIYGTYRDPSDDWEVFSGVLQSHFNLTHSYTFENWLDAGYTSTDVDEMLAAAGEFLDLAEAAGVGVFYGLPRAAVLAEDTAVLTEVIMALKDKPALWFWYLYDEPSSHASYLSPMQTAYNLVQTLDPCHPAVIVDTAGDGNSRLSANPEIGEQCDSLWIDRYHVPYGVFEIKRHLEVVRGLFPDKVIWAVPESGDRQSYLQPGWLDDPFPSRVEINDMNTCNSAEALRAQAHACLTVPGVHGLIYYWGPRYWVDVKNDTPDLWQGHIDLGNELKALSEVLVSEDVPGAVSVTVDRWGMYDRMDHLYNRDLSSSEYPDEDHVLYWVRQYKGSLYMGFTCTYMPMQKVTVTLPYAFERVVQYPSQRTIVRAVDGGLPEVYQDHFDATMWDVPDNQTISFVLNDLDSVVLRFDAVDATESFSYSEDFDGDNASMPADWVIHEGGADIRSNTLTTNYNAGSTMVASCEVAGKGQWQDFSMNWLISHNYSFPTGSSQQSSLFAGIAFRMQDAANYYLARVRKMSGSSNPSVVISKVVDGVVSDLGFIALDEAMLPGVFYRHELNCYGSYFELRVWSGETLLGEAAGVDDDYAVGGVGIHSEMSAPYRSRYDDLVIEGMGLDAAEQCRSVISQGYGLVGDIDQDCYVGLKDLTVLGADWLDCMDPEVEGCVGEWMD